ncbi:amidohydrolase family protein [Blastococcus sp. SYSU DS0828]
MKTARRGDRRPVRALLEVRPQNLLWGTDWPHVNLQLPRPDAAGLRERLDRWVPDPAVRHAVLVDSPARRYGFGPVGAPSREPVGSGPGRV